MSELFRDPVTVSQGVAWYERNRSMLIVKHPGMTILVDPVKGTCEANRCPTTLQAAFERKYPDTKAAMFIVP